MIQKKYNYVETKIYFFYIIRLDLNQIENFVTFMCETKKQEEKKIPGI